MNESQCPRCAADPQPQSFGSPRNCAFKAGLFDPDNWNCATMNALENVADVDEHCGNDESMQIVRVLAYGATETNGFIVLSRYKHRGKCSSAVHVGDFFPSRPLTLDLAEQVIAEHASEEARATNAVDPHAQPQESRHRA